MKVIGITGGVGSGKSAVLKEIKQKYNCEIFIADDAAKKLEQKGMPCYEPLINLLGEDILDENLQIMPKAMSQKIFTDPALLQAVNDIVHPAVKAYILETIEKHKKAQDIVYFFIEAALLIECGYMEVVDEMWYIYTNEGVRRERLKASRGYSDEKIDSIMMNQLSEEEYRKNCTFIVDNSYSLEKTMEIIDKRLGMLR